MPHSSGGGSHGGGFHGGSRSGSRSANARISRTPYPGARRYRYHTRGGYRYFYTTREPGKIFQPARLLYFLLMIPMLIAGIGMIIATYRTGTSRHDQEIIVRDEAGVLSDDAALMDALVKFREKTHITPAVLTVHNEDWQGHYLTLERYAYDCYVDTFDDEMHWLIVYSEPQEIKDPNNIDWHWEGMQGDDTDLILTEEIAEDFGKLLHQKIEEDPKKLSENLTAAFEKAASKAGWSGVKNIVSGLFLIATTLFFGYFASGLDELKYRKAEPDPEQSA